MASVAVKVVKVFWEGQFAVDQSFVLGVSLLPRLKARTAETTFQDGNVLRCGSIWTLLDDHSVDARLWVGLMRRRPIISDEKVATVVVPLVWLPTDKVVKSGFR